MIKLFKILKWSVIKKIQHYYHDYKHSSVVGISRYEPIKNE